MVHSVSDGPHRRQVVPFCSTAGHHELLLRLLLILTRKCGNRHMGHSRPTCTNDRMSRKCPSCGCYMMDQVGLLMLPLTLALSASAVAAWMACCTWGSLVPGGSPALTAWASPAPGARYTLRAFGTATARALFTSRDRIHILPSLATCTHSGTHCALPRAQRTVC